MRFALLADVYERLYDAKGRLEKTKCIADLLAGLPTEELFRVIILLQGKVFPDFDERKIGVAAKLALKAINIATGIPTGEIEQGWKNTGDLGIAAMNATKTKKQATLFSAPLETKKVFDNLQKLAEIEGAGTVDRKVKLMAELLTSASPIEAKYIIRAAIGDLRVGVAAGTLRDAITWAFLYDMEKLKYDDEKKTISPDDREDYSKVCNIVQRAYDLCGDFGEVARIAKENGIGALNDIKIRVGRPMKVMLCQKAAGIEDAFERVGRPCAFEYKYDGFRIQAHKSSDGTVTLFTRRLENVTKQFPDVVEHVANHVRGESFIIDCEAVGFDPTTGKYLPFQHVSQRIRRKYDIEELAKKLPIELSVFDIMFYEGKNMMDSTYKERRELIKSIIDPVEKELVVSKQIITDSDDEARAFYDQAVKDGEEGVIAKNFDGLYKPGSRVGHQVKIKPVMETLDLVITGAEWGEGKRGGWLSSFTVSCYDESSNGFVEIGRVGTGIKELEQESDEEAVTFNQLTELLRPHITSESGREVTITPTVVIEVKFEEIQKSPTYSSGYALRFPRLVRIRDDKDPTDASSHTFVEDLFYAQGS